MRSLLRIATGLLVTATAGAAVGVVPAAAVERTPRAVHSATQPARAGGAVTIGSTAGASAFAAGFAGFSAIPVSVAPGTPSYTVPGAGVLTSLSYQAGVAGNIRAILLGPGGTPDLRTVRGYSGLLAAVGATTNTYPVRIPVAADTSLGLWVDTQFMTVSKGTASTADVYNASVDDPTVVTSYDITVSPTTERRVDISAVWEPDVDGDQYGDVSQDLCPELKSQQAACPAPDTTITKAPGKRSYKRKATIEFASTIPGSTFTCAVDMKAVKPCTSPFKKRFKPGKHTVVITATSPVGIVDPTPAPVSFKVRKRR